MKKLVLMLAVAFSVSLFSCGGSDADKANDSADSANKADSLAKVDAEAAAKAAAEAAPLVTETEETPADGDATPAPEANN